MIVKIAELSDAVRRADFRSSAAELNTALEAGCVRSAPRFREDPEVRAEVYRHGTDVYFCGSVSGVVNFTCPRCMEEFAWPLAREFNFLLVREGGPDVPEDDAGLGHYSGDEIDLAPLAREQAMLGLDDTVLCTESCRGLCSQCGTNLNREECGCEKARSANNGLRID